MPEMARRIVEQYDQPFGDCSAIPTMLLAEASKKYITVALTGDGGDEAFGGYERYWAADPKKGIVGYAPWLCVIPPPYMEKLLDEAWYKSLNCQQTLAWLLERAITHPGQGLHNQMMWLDIHTYLLNDIIVKMERASMAASVEVRCPFLDHRVMELACAIPDMLKIGDGFGKLVLKEAFKDELPTEVLLRPKRGFGVPVNEWFRRPEGKQMLSDMVSDTRWPWDIFNPKEVATIIEGHLGGRHHAGHALWMFVVLDLWMKKHFG
jgi:asparagine synthase (glutamine-hydrolysing)